jgi:hypothetical protein
VLAPEELVRRQQQNDEPKKKPKTAQQQQQQRRAKEIPAPELPTSTAPKRLKSVEQKMTCLARMVLEQSKLRRTRKSDEQDVDAKGDDDVKEEENPREPRESYIFSVLTSELTPHLVQQYTCEQVHALIESVPGCGQIAQVFREQLIDGDAFLLITKKDIPTHIPTGAKVKLLYLINIINCSSR